MGSEESPMVLMRIIVVGLVGKRSIPLHFLPNNSPILRPFSEALRIGPWREKLNAELLVAMP